MTRLRATLYGVTWSGLQGCPPGRATFTNETAARAYADQTATEWPTVTLHKGTTEWAPIEEWDTP